MLERAVDQMTRKQAPVLPMQDGLTIVPKGVADCVATKPQQNQKADRESKEPPRRARQHGVLRAWKHVTHTSDSLCYDPAPFRAEPGASARTSAARFGQGS